MAAPILTGKTSLPLILGVLVAFQSVVPVLGDGISVQELVALGTIADALQSQSWTAPQCQLLANASLYTPAQVCAISECVTCDDSNTTITSITLENIGAAGNFPPQLCDLFNVTLINITGNNVTGELPQCLCGLSRLQSLDIANNQLHGGFPMCIQSLVNLEFLNVGGNFNMSSANLSVVCPLKQLTYLSVQSMSILGRIPECLCGLTRLETVVLNGNSLSHEIPTCVCNMINLRTLDFGNNTLNGTIPSCISQLQHLETLDMESNLLTGGVPGEQGLCDIASLRTISLRNNLLMGALPGCFGSLPQLTKLNVAINHLSGPIPQGLCNAPLLVYLSLRSNSFVAGIPECVCGLTSLTLLNLEINSLNGTIPTCVCQLVKLTALNLGTNQLTGPLPSCISSLTLLQYLSLHSNAINEQIPLSLCDIETLNVVQLRNNSISGDIPACLCKLINLNYLDLASNFHEGHIPECMCNMYNLTIIAFANNTITGHLPSCFGNLLNLNVLDVHNNSLSGPLPASIFQLPQLQLLFLSGATLTGSIPYEGNLPEITALAMVDCGIGGIIPQWIGNLSNLVALELSGNHLTGVIPTFHQAPSKLTSFAASNNILKGTLDPLESARTTLQQLDLRYNRIEGVVPVWLGEQSEHMTLLALRHNKLSCDLPPSTSIDANNQSGDLNLLLGNVFSCPIPTGIKTKDIHSKGYACASSNLKRNGSICLGVSLLVALGCAFFYWHIEHAHIAVGSGEPKAPLDTLFRWCAGILALSWSIILLPVYAYSPSTLNCRYGWVATAAYLEPGSFAAYVMLIVGGIGGGLALILLVAMPGIRQGAVLRLWASKTKDEVVKRERLETVSRERIATLGRDRLSTMEARVMVKPRPKSVSRSRLPSILDGYSTAGIANEEEEEKDNMSVNSLKGNVDTATPRYTLDSDDDDDDVDDYDDDVDDDVDSDDEDGKYTDVSPNPIANDDINNNNSNNSSNNSSSNTNAINNKDTDSNIASNPTYQRADANTRKSVSKNNNTTNNNTTTTTTNDKGGGDNDDYDDDDDEANNKRSVVPRIEALATVTLALVLGIGANYGFVQLENLPGLTPNGHFAFVVLFSFVHEVIDARLVYYIIWKMVREFGTYNAYVATVIVQLCNSVLAALLSFMFGSEECLAPLFHPPRPITTTFDFRICSEFNEDGYTDNAVQTSTCYAYEDKTDVIDYKPPFEFDGGRCVSSIIALYTPVYLMIFTLRILRICWMQIARIYRLSTYRERRYGTAPIIPKDSKMLVVPMMQRTLLRLNCVAIGLCTGVLSPLLIIAAFVCLIMVAAILSLVSRLPKPKSNPHTIKKPAITAKRPGLPLECIGLCLAAQSVYIVVFSKFSGLGYLGFVAVGINFGAFFIAATYVRPPEAVVDDTCVVWNAAFEEFQFVNNDNDIDNDNISEHSRSSSSTNDYFSFFSSDKPPLMERLLGDSVY